MTLDQLEVLEMIVEKGSFKAAAEALHRTQPTLSIAIKKLENEFDLLLFSRETYRPRLTPAGELFYGWAKQTLKSYRDLSVLGHELGTQKIEPRLTVVIDPLTRFESIHGIFTACLREPIPTELTLQSEVLEASVERLLNGEAEIAIAPLFQNHGEIESYPFEAIELLPCVRKSLLGKGQRSLENLEPLTQIIVRSPLANREHHTIGVQVSGRRCYVSDHGMKKALIREGFGWGHLARHEIETELKSKDLVLLTPHAQPLFLTLYLMRNRRRPLGPVAQAVWTRLRDRKAL